MMAIKVENKLNLTNWFIYFTLGKALHERFEAVS